MSAILEVEAATKSYGPVTVLRDVSLAVSRPTAFAITGENGAGKSTLLKVISGAVSPDAGEIRIDGHSVTGSPQEARRRGVAVVHQHLSLVPEMTIAENCSLANLPTRAGLVRRTPLFAAAERVLERIGLDRDPRMPIHRLSFAERQLLEIGKALIAEPRLLLLDEPTASLTPSEVAILADLVRDVVNEGAAVGYVSHRLPEIMSVCDSAYVLRDGSLVASLDLGSATPEQLVSAMVGRELATVTGGWPRRGERGEVRLDVDSIIAPGVGGVSLQVRAGEILGIGGLVGAGRSELANAIFGLSRLSAGRVVVERVEIRRASPSSAIRAGMALVQEDRHLDGLALPLSAWENISVPMFREFRAGPLLKKRTLRNATRRVLTSSGVRPATPTALASSLSGGNQQKIVIGRWLAVDLRVLILDEPTIGVDVAAKAQIHERILAEAANGLAVLLISSDLPELLALSDRIAVMHDGTIAGELTREDEWTEESVIALATQGGELGHG